MASNTTVVPGINDPGLLDWRTSITDKDGRPSPQFQRMWNTQRSNTAQIGIVSFASGPPTAANPTDGTEYVDTSTTPFNLYIAQGGNWNLLTPQSDDPTAIASDTATDGTASTFMRSDASPAVQKATTSQFGLVKPDGTSINVSTGLISVPTATSTVLGLVKPDGTSIKNTAGAISVPTATTSQLGLVQPDGTTVVISAGIISAVGGGGGGGGDLTRIAQVICSSSQSSVIFSGIPSTFSNLILTYMVRSNSASGVDIVDMQFNIDTGANYIYMRENRLGNVVATSAGSMQLAEIPNSTSPAGTAATGTARFAGYNSSTFWKSYENNQAQWDGTNILQERSAGYWKNTAALTTIFLFLGSANSFTDGSTFTLYGMK